MNTFIYVRAWDICNGTKDINEVVERLTPDEVDQLHRMIAIVKVEIEVQAEIDEQ